MHSPISIVRLSSRHRPHDIVPRDASAVPTTGVEAQKAPKALAFSPPKPPHCSAFSAASCTLVGAYTGTLAHPTPKMMAASFHFSSAQQSMSYWAEVTARQPTPLEPIVSPSSAIPHKDMSNLVMFRPKRMYMTTKKFLFYCKGLLQSIEYRETKWKCFRKFSSERWLSEHRCLL